MQRLIQSLHDGAAVITATRRLARSVADSYNSAQQALGERCWPSAKVQPWQDFIETCWCQCLDLGIVDRPLATADWQRCLWQQAIAATNPLLNINATAIDAIAADRLVVHYAIDRSQVGAYGTAETAAYCTWSQHVRERLSARQMIGFCDAELQLISIVQQRFAPLRQRLAQAFVIAGFEQMTPLQQRLLAAMKAQAVAVTTEWRPLARPAPRSVRYELTDEDAELRASAAWARQSLEQNPHLYIAVIISDIERRRQRIEQVFADCLHPQHLLPQPAAARHSAFNISLGSPLVSLAPVSDALAGLALLAPTVSVRSIGQFLRSRFFADDENEYRARVLLDAELRRRSEPLTSLEHLISIAAKRAVVPPPELWLKRLHAMADLTATTASAVVGAKAWSEYFTYALQRLAWPGALCSDSTTWQAVSATQEVLLRFSCLDGVLPAMTVDSALQRISALLMDTVHQPGSVSTAPIQILGVIESLGMCFDRLWVIGANSEHWPGEVRANAFLPLALQRRFGVPDSSPAAVREQAMATLSRLQAAADEVVFSHALNVEDRTMSVSPLLSAIPVAPPTAARPTAIEAQCRQQALGAELELIADPSPRLPADDRQWRGVEVLQHQSQCPFKAFATHRLAATTVTARSCGWDGRERGLLVHWLMADIWRHLGDQHRLNSITDKQLEKLIACSTDQALYAMQRRYPNTLNAGLRRLEQQRLHQLATVWLARVERQRPPFAVKAHEQTLKMQWPGLCIQIRPDRIDTLESGGICVIDYKTSVRRTSDWDGERPDDPQLPIYALALLAQGEQVEALAFAQLVADADTMRLSGIGDAVGTANAKQTLTDAMLGWQQTLAALADGFVSGERNVAPKNPAQTCRYCELSALCRVHELRDVTTDAAP